MVDVRGDVLRPPHGTTPAAVKANKIQKWVPLRAMKTFIRKKMGHTTSFRLMSTKVIPYTTPCPPMPCLPGHTIYHSAIRYILPCSPGHTIYHAMPGRPYHISSHAHQVISYTMPCRLGIECTKQQKRYKGPKGHVSRCPIVMSIVKEDDSF